ncbi:MAG: tRNA preQ1(34) S-adenosylmethionine ribosyltransferase-isomerase QueA [Erysipelothrix sp.]|nr:tRNA preQ1(34) S-adenosylmethionine ribosyltransferase-isomerase QueA [Erysipelothrix sp.]
MQKHDFYFDLPEELIAQVPIENRSASKLMVIDKEKQTIKSTVFTKIKDLLQKGDVLVLNDTKVILARLFGIKEGTGAKIEILLLKEIKKDRWQALVGNAKAVKLDSVVNISDKIWAKCVEVLENGLRVFELSYQGNFYEVLDTVGNIPLPPYIHAKLQDNDRYQTVYAKNSGSAAAPTAGLHFTKDLIKEVEEMGVIVKYITLHVGLGTFMPVKVDDILDHNMHSEQYIITKDTAKALNLAKANGNKIIAVGSTSVRTLESNFKKFNQFQAEVASTNIFIYPGIELQAIDAMITNFHLPESTLIMLVSAFCGYDLTMRAYQEAVAQKYRFFSFGDVMWIS